MRIAIDIDSTLHHYWDQFAEIAQRRYGVELPYNEQLAWGVTQMPREQAETIVHETHTPRYVAAAVPYEGAVEAVRDWHGRGHYIHITTHRAVGAHEATAKWLDEQGIPYDDLYCSYDKVTRCVELDIDLLIDDSPVNLERALERGIGAATLDHPWNAELVARRPEIVHARDWARLKPAIDAWLERERSAA